MRDLEKRKVREGLVVSNKMAKTVVVAVETRKVNPLYKKAIRVTKRYKAHDENNACKIGDKVKIVETRPLSKEKRWQVAEIVSTRKIVETKPK
jgi:small subunit ribosomal protein S17